MSGIELWIKATKAVELCQQRGVIVNETHDTVVRLLPPINISAEEVDDGCAVVAEVLRELSAGN